LDFLALKGLRDEILGEEDFADMVEFNLVDAENFGGCSLTQKKGRIL